MLLVQFIMGLALIACLIIATIIFSKLLKQKEGKNIFLQFLAIELAIFILILLTLKLSIKDIQGFAALIIISFFCTLFANIPLAIIAKIVEVVIRRKQKV